MDNQPGRSREFTLLAIILGAVLAIIMCAANTYLGLYAGMTVSASIPAAVISMAILRGMLKRGTIRENNIVQTMASAGESLAAGIIFTVPAILLVGIWQDFRFWPTTLIAITGGLLGIVFMIPLRRALIVEEKELKYPEGVACAEVLKAGEEKNEGFRYIIHGILIGGIFKFFTTGLALLKGSVEAATRLGSRVLFTGFDASPALVAVGYIVNLEIAVLVFAGGFFGWNIVLPFLGTPAGMENAGAIDIAWTLWSTKVRYVGVGAMIIGGLWSIFMVRSGIARGLNGLFNRTNLKSDSTVDSTDRDLNPVAMAGVLAATVFVVLMLYNYLTGSFPLSLLTTLIMVVSAFFFVAVSSFIVGLVGSSNNPVSGMTICVLLGTGLLLLAFGLREESAIFATLGVAGVVCCAACSAGDISQDLKTGHLVGASPRYQQMAQIIAVIISAFTIAPILSLLHAAYGIGDGLKAPQATLFASITEGMFGEGSLPKGMIALGMGLGIGIILIDRHLQKNKSPFRLHIMPVAVGVYLPLSLSVPMLFGGLIRHFTDKSGSVGQNRGVLLSSGLIAGEAIMGIIIAVIIYLNINIKVPLPEKGFINVMVEFTTLAALLAVGWFLGKRLRDH